MQPAAVWTFEMENEKDALDHGIKSSAALNASMPAPPAPLQALYPFPYPSHPQVIVAPHAYGFPHQAHTWVVKDEASPWIRVGRSYTCVPRPGDMSTYFDATILGVRFLERNYVEFLARVYPSSNLTTFIHLRVTIEQAKLPPISRLRYVTCRRFLPNTIWAPPTPIPSLGVPLERSVERDAQRVSRWKRIGRRGD
ncbi:hypothetical protein A0H81_06524 [Grifola frondosa]|uniref:Uncharacterized protein n=1 Tax=Grifola frondosa TaxID=5627 RepID=A0A1C7MAF7_GRIFR|nr:hypothetical protein A0H81_06524 [Grifola frondosa]